MTDAEKVLADMQAEIDTGIRVLEEAGCDDGMVGRHLHPDSERCLGAECCVTHDWAKGLRDDVNRALDIARKVGALKWAEDAITTMGVFASLPGDPGERARANAMCDALIEERDRLRRELDEVTRG